MARTTTGARAAVLLLCGALLTACTGGDDGPTPDPTGGGGTTSPDATDQTAGGTAAPSGTEEATTEGPPTMPDSVESELAALDPEQMSVQGSGTGEIPFADAPLTAEVLEVRRHDDGLDLTFRLTPEQDITSQRFAQELSLDRESREISAVRLVSGEEYVGPLVYQADPDEWDIADMRCLCSKMPLALSTDGFVLHATFADFDEPVDTVSVVVPGFEEIADIPVQ